MKSTLLVVLGVSAILNVVLLVGDPREAVASGGGIEFDTDSDKAGQSRGPHSAAAGGQVSAIRASAEVWASLESTDLATLRDRLRAVGFPETIVRALVGRRIEALFEARRLERYGPPKVEPFWKTRDPGGEREMRAFERGLAREQRMMNAELLGSSAAAPDARSYLFDRLGFLPSGKMELIRSIEADYSDMVSEVRGDGFGGMSQPEDREKFQLLEREKQADIAAALTPEELELYQLYMSSAANMVRGRLRGFDITEEEFLALYALQKDFEDRFPSNRPGPRSQDEMRARAAAENAMKDQTKVVLGEARFAEYQRATNPAYRAAVKIVEHFNLPRENAAAVYDLEAESRRRRDEVSRGSTEPTERAAAMRALAAEFGGRVDALLGAEGGKVFRRYGGNWLRSLEQQAQPSSGAPRRP